MSNTPRSRTWAHATSAEMERLEALILIVWNEGQTHYSSNCYCESCKTTRSHLSPRDREFIDLVADNAASAPHPDIVTHLFADTKP